MRGMTTFLQKHLDDLLALIGASLIIYATSLLSLIAALFVAGGFCLVGSLVIGVSRSRNDHQPRN